MQLISSIITLHARCASNPTSSVRPITSNMALCMQRSATGLRAAAQPRPFAARRLVVRASAKKNEEQTVVSKLAMPMAATLAASMLLGAQMVSPPEALAARSGGRAGASSFSARREAPRRASPQVNSYSSTTIVAAPPVYSPFGFGGFGFGGVSIMPVIPFPFFGGLLQFMFLMLVVGFVFNVVRGAVEAANSGSKSKKQDWDDL